MRRMPIWPSYLLVGLLAAPASAQKTNSVDQAARYGREAMRQMLEKSRAPGASVAVAVEGKLVWAEGFGFADLAGKSRIEAGTRFGIGSITKSLTTALMGRLRDKNKLDWYAPIETYLPDWPHKGKGITSRLIATHLSGMNDAFSSALMFTPKHYSTAEALAEIVKEPLRAEPRTETLYGTGTYTVLAAVIEKVTGGTFVEAMRNHVLEPLKLADTLPNDPRQPLPRRTSFFRLDGTGRVEEVPYFDPSHKLAGAGFLSTAPDLATFASSLLQPGFLKRQTIDELFTESKNLKGESTTFAMGWRTVKDHEGRPIYAQPGGGPGISGVVVIWPKERTVVALLTNLTGAPVGGTAQEIGGRFMENGRNRRKASLSQNYPDHQVVAVTGARASRPLAAGASRAGLPL